MRRKYNLIVRYFCLFLALLLTVTSTSAFALNFPAGKEDLYIQNNILFYEPGTETRNFEQEDCSRYLSASSFSGVQPTGNGPENTNAMYIVSRLREAGYDNPAIAGIMGNLQGEDSKFDPNDVEYKEKYGGRIAPPTTGNIENWQGYNNVGYGIVQWTSSGRQKGLDNYAVKTNRQISDLDLQVDWLIHELKSYGSDVSNLNNKSVEETTFQILRKYEMPGNIIYSTHDGKYYNDYVPNSYTEINETKTPGAYKTFTTRLGYAKAFYQKIEVNYETAIANQVSKPDTSAYEACLMRQSSTYGIQCNSSKKIWYNTKYPDLTDEDLYALIRVAIAENGEGEGMEKELSIIANLNEIYNKSGTYGNLVNYVRTSEWFHTKNAIDDTGYTSEYAGSRYTKESVERNLSIADDIIRKGRRRIPPQIYEHDNIGDITYIKNDGVTYTDRETIENRSNYISGKTIIKAQVSTESDEYVFWEFARYVNGKPDGDPFGYPLASSLSQPNEDTCSGSGALTPGTPIAASELTIEIPTTELIKYSGSTLSRIKELFPGVTIPTKSENSNSVDYKRLWDAIPPSAIWEAGTYTYNPSTRELNTKNAKRRTDSFFTTFKIDYYDSDSQTIKQRSITMHKSIEEIVKKAFHEVAIRGYATDNTTYGLSYRGMASDSSKLSNHSLGTAFDINTQDNPFYSWSCSYYQGVGTKLGGDDSCIYYSTQNPKAVPIWVANIFIYYGFRWLGDHDTDGRKYDPMHFSYTLN